MLIASVLAVFDILPPVDESGNPVDIDLDHYNGFVAFPSIYKCIIKPRSPEAEALIKATEEMNHVV
ncbi:hypothetical protein AX14_012997 [Amanita brunnescens Koide BX004]|nr:hypothetical protein AX14_012997 [Amanita brunnescens Koide BX004]